MTTTAVRPIDAPPRQQRPLRPWTQAVVPLAVIVAVLGRLPFLDRLPGADESGFLMVGRQWDGAGSSLYGSYWVDRPPLLITIFRWAAQLGGVIPLRLFGCVAAGLVVVGAADVARRISGPRAARWAAVVAACWVASPLLGPLEVNGELLAAPFVLGGLSTALSALSTDGRRGLLRAAAAGSAVVGALMVKQNMADAGVFASVAWTLACLQGRITRRRLGQLIVAAAIGAGVAVTVVAGWTMMHGTSVADVYQAIYPFRLQADHVMATYGGNHATGRLARLIALWVVSGAAVVVAVSSSLLISRRLRGPACWALGATVLYAAASVLLGGNFWVHYLVELIGPVAVLAGVLVAHTRWIGRAVAFGVALVAVLAWGVLLRTPPTHPAATLGYAVAAAARPQDTIVTVYGHADVDAAAGLRSPYPYLWSLPLKTLDPDLTRLDRTLSGPDAPTWLVTWYRLSSWGVDSHGFEATVRARYHHVATVCGHAVYLRNGLDRSAPTSAHCPPTNPFTTTQEIRP